MAVPDELIEAFDVDDAGFIADPYPVLGAIREATPIFWNESSSAHRSSSSFDVASMCGSSLAIARGVNTFVINRRMRV